MLAKLRIQFTLTAGAVLTAIISVVLLIGGWGVWAGITEDADEILDILSSGHGDVSEYAYEHADRQGLITEELPFELRWFSVRLDSAGSADLGHIAAIDAETAQAYASQVQASGQQRGYVSSFRYLMIYDDMGSIVYFIDRGRQLASFRDGMFRAVEVAVIGIVAVLLAILALSRRVVEPIAETYRKQNEFVGNASHDLKTPVAVINADADVLAMDYPDNEFVLDIKDQTKLLSSLIEDLMFISSLDASRSMPIFTFDAAKIVQAQADGFAKIAVRAGKGFICDVDGEIPFTGDQNTIRQISSILMDNAVKYASDGGRVDVSARCRKLYGRPPALVLTVSNDVDEGAVTDVSHWFDRFYRSDPSRTGDVDKAGFGIGLSMAQTITDAYHGKISAKTSKDGRRITITASLPSRPAPPKPKKSRKHTSKQ